MSPPPFASRAALLDAVGHVTYGPHTLTHERAQLPDAVLQRIAVRNTTLRALLGLRGSTYTFQSYHPELSAALVPAPEALPPAVRAALSGHSRDPSKRGVSLGVKGHWLAAHQHFAAVSVQLSGRKAWLLAPPFYPAEVLHTARLTKVGDAAAGRLACGLARG